MAARNLPEMPCGPVLELNGQRKRFHVPYGLKPLIEKMTREVLRYQPDNIYEFLAVLMEQRLKAKDTEKEQNKRRKSWQSYRWSWEGTSVLKPNELSEFLEDIHMSQDKAEHSALVIQSAFRGFKARQRVKEIRRSRELPEAQVKPKAEEKRESLNSEGKPRTRSRRSSLFEITPENITNDELKSVVIIQSGFRGMQARKRVKELRKSLTGEEPMPEPEPPKPGEAPPSPAEEEKPPVEEPAPPPPEPVESAPLEPEAEAPSPEPSPVEETEKVEETSPPETAEPEQPSSPPPPPLEPAEPESQAVSEANLAPPVEENPNPEEAA